MVRKRALLLVPAMVAATAVPLAALPANALMSEGDVFISEVHYDNDGIDVGEAIEVQAPVGTDLTGWQIVLYNGSNGASYGTTTLSGAVGDAGVVVQTYPENGIQNGSPDGIALVDATGTVVEFLSYEGEMTAAGGPADGLASTDIGVSQPSATPVGQSLQRVDDVWTGPQANSFGARNAGGDGPVEAFISELHYDNVGADAGEAVEIQAAAGTDLTGWSIVLYNGNGGAPYSTRTLSGVVGDAGVLVETYPANGIQNGSPDGVALVDATGVVVEFLSYEGAMTGVGGPANGLVSSDIGVMEADSTPVGWSLQVLDGVWTGPAENSFGTRNGAVDPVTCGDPATGLALISDIQGDGATFDPACGGTQTVEAVVTAIHPGLSGFYVQEEPGDSDGDPATSEGIFVFGAIPEALETGDLVRITGTVGEYMTDGGATNQTQLRDAAVENLGDTTPIEPTPVTFPVTAPDALEAYEGMLVVLTDTLVISEYFNYDRFGEVVLAKPLEGQDRLHTPTAVVEPGDEARALLAEYERRIITLDDAVSAQNQTTVPHPGNGEPFSATNTFRGGDTVTGVTGVVDNTFGLYRIQPTEYGRYEAVNDRPETAPAVGGTLQVASFNVLNYFLTLDQGGAVCGADTDQDCRGANTAAELERQRTKILAALAGLDADVVGLMEMENTPGVEPAADLVAGLNEMLGEGTYAYVDTGVIGTDAIRLGLLYKPAAVQPVGDFAVLDSGDDPRFDDTKNRPMLTQTFEEVATGEVFTVSVNHLKSKGSACDDGSDPTDGQGNCSVTRELAAEAIVDYLAGDPTGSGDPDHLVIGDLNSYDHEDSIDVFVAAGYTDLIKRFGGEYAYGYVFDGMVGYLDHALSNETLTEQVTGAAEWHINADEPDILDYNLDFGRPASYWTGDEYRSSDHDAVLVGLDLFSPDTTAPTLAVELSHESLWPANHKYVDVTATVTAEDDRPGVTWELVSVTSDEPDDGIGDGSTVNDVVVVDDTHVRLRAERSAAGDGRVYTFTYRATDAAGNTTEATATVDVPLNRGG